MAKKNKKAKIPKNRNDVVSAVERLGYEKSYSRGGHDYYVLEDSKRRYPGQLKKVTIPTTIKTEDTRQAILEQTCFFEAHGMSKDGTRIKRESAIPERSEEEKQMSRFVKDNRAWKKQMKQFDRGLGPRPDGRQPTPPK